ncbi:MAG: antitoxin VapB family protein [Promethearchaeota archaeon]
MTSKTISVTEEVYNTLMKYKDENESFSEFFKRLIEIRHQNMEKTFGSWNLSPDEEEYFTDIGKRDGRRWNQLELGE